ncbi:34236_t:CDS:1, partial [Gigaspora margarita]
MYRYKEKVYDPPRRTRGRPGLQTECKETKVVELLLLLEDPSGTNEQSGVRIPSVRFPILAILD